MSSYATRHVPRILDLESAQERERPLFGFTDGRIHVTLCEGAFDLRDLSVDEVETYAWLIECYAEGLPLESFLKLAELGTLDPNWRHVWSVPSLPIPTIHRDLCTRIKLVLTGMNDEQMSDLRPWRPTATHAVIRTTVAPQ